jgi:hypothetical protein
LHCKHLWAVWVDIDAWSQWSPGIAEINVNGPFTAGTTFAMIPAPGEEPVNMRLAEVVDGEHVTDECDFGGAVVTTMHRLEPLGDGGTRLPRCGGGVDHSGVVRLHPFVIATPRPLRNRKPVCTPYLRMGMQISL